MREEGKEGEGGQGEKVNIPVRSLWPLQPQSGMVSDGKEEQGEKEELEREEAELLQARKQQRSDR